MGARLLDEDFLRRIESLTLVSRRIFRGRMKGERRSRRRGFSSEFADYRNYVEGDDLRFIDWNIYGRLDRLFLKLFLEEEDLHVHVLVDASLSMGFGEPRKIDYARRVAAAIAYIALNNMDRVQVHAFSGGLHAATDALRGKKQSWRLFDFLEGIDTVGATALSDSCRQFSTKTRRGKGVVVLISDFLDPAGYEDGIKRLLGNESDLYVVHLLSPEEIRPDLKGDLRLVDVEDGMEQEITVSRPLLKQYEETLNNFCGGLRDYCTRRGAIYVFSSTDMPFDQLVLNALRAGGLLQ